MSKAMPTPPPYTSGVGDHELVGHHGPPPPSYDQGMGQGQPASAPYPHQNMGMGMHPMHQVPPPHQHHAAPPVVTAVVVGGAVTGAVVPVGPKPVTMRCPHCNMDIRTKTRTEFQGNAHIAAIILFVLGCWLCSCIPYLIDTYRNVKHSCPNCNAFLGMYSP